MERVAAMQYWRVEEGGRKVGGESGNVLVNRVVKLEHTGTAAATALC